MEREIRALSVPDKIRVCSRFEFSVVTDRVHPLEAVAICADKIGKDYGQWSDAKVDTSEV